VAWTRPQTGLISAISDPACGSCREFESTAKRLVSNQQRYEGPPVSIAAASSVSPIGDSERVAMTLTQQERRILDRSGKTVATDQRSTRRLVALVRWHQGRWRLAAIQVI
jgi:hypothetical protein